MTGTGRGSAFGMTRYGPDGLRDRIPVGAKFSALVQTGPADHPAPLYNEYRVIAGSKAAGAWR